MHRRLHEERTIDPSTIAKVSGTVTATRFAPAIGPAVRVAMNEPSESVCRSISSPSRSLSFAFHLASRGATALDKCLSCERAPLHFA